MSVSLRVCLVGLHPYYMQRQWSCRLSRGHHYELSNLQFKSYS